MENFLVKQDINLLEYPIWFQNKKLAERTEGYVWMDREGYTYRAGYKPPTKTDILFLYCLMLYSQSENWAESITLTRYRLLNDCGIQPGKQWFDRIEESLKRWKMIGIEYHGTFYDGRDYKTINFGIIDEWTIDKKTKKLHVKFSSTWLLKIRQSNYFKYIHFESLKRLKSPLVIRLYEILIKSFQGRNIWKIDAMKLAEKIPMKEKYPSDVIPKVRAAINRINEHTNLKFKFTAMREERGKALLVFEKLSNGKAKKLPPAAGLPEDDRLEELSGLLPREHQGKKTILEVMARSYEKHGFEFVANNIRYANAHCRGNYRAYLIKALKENWGEALKEDEEARERVLEEEERRAKEEAERKRKEAEKLERDRELFLQAEKYIKSLSSGELEALRAQALENYYSKTENMGGKRRSEPPELVLNILMKTLVTERLKG